MLWLQKILAEAQALTPEQIAAEAKDWPLPPGKAVLIGSIEDPLLRALIALNVMKVKATEQQIGALNFQGTLIMGLTISDEEKYVKLQELVVQKLALSMQGEEELRVFASLVQLELDQAFPKLPENSNGLALGSDWNIYAIEPQEEARPSVIAILMGQGDQEEEKPPVRH